jgi:hypothetical protein
MNLDQNKRFEAQLRKLKPAPVDRGLQDRIETALKRESRVQRREKFRSLVSWAGLAVAASLLITFGVLLFNGRLVLGPDQTPAVVVEPVEADADSASESIPESGDFKPVLAENNLQNRIDEGIVFLRNGLTARRYRYEFVDRVVWRNPVDGATVEMKIPRDEVVLVPVQTF